MEVKVRVFENADEEHVNALFSRVFGVPRSQEEFRWKFAARMSQSTSFGGAFVAEAGNRIVGAYMSISTQHYVLGKKVESCLVVDNCVDPSFRKGNTQRRLFAEFARGSRGAISFAYGFPNEIAFPVGTRLLKYLYVGDLPLLELPREGMKTNGDSNTAVEVRSIQGFGEDHDQFWSTRREDFKVIQDRCSRTLNWRYFSAPNQDFVAFQATQGSQVKGYVVLKIEQDQGLLRGLVFDLLAIEDSAVSKALVRSAVDFFKERGVDYIQAWCPQGSEPYLALTSNGFLPRPVGAMKLVILLYDDPPIEERNRCLLESIRNWYLMLGDTDR